MQPTQEPSGRVARVNSRATSSGYRPQTVPRLERPVRNRSRGRTGREGKPLFSQTFTREFSHIPAHFGAVQGSERWRHTKRHVSGAATRKPRGRRKKGMEVGSGSETMISETRVTAFLRSFGPLPIESGSTRQRCGNRASFRVSEQELGGTAGSGASGWHGGRTTTSRARGPQNGSSRVRCTGIQRGTRGKRS